MENFSYHVPFYVVTGGVKTSGHSSDLNAGAVGLYDRATFSVATALGNGKEFFFAQGNTGGKDWYGQPVTETHKSAFFYGKDVENIYLSQPQTPQNEEWVLGYNGSPSSKGLVFEAGKAVRVKLFFHGQPIYRFFGGVKEYVVSYTPPVDCTDPCDGNDCPEAIADCLTHTQALVNQINTHTELQKFGVRAAIVANTSTPTAANMIKYCLTVCDNGDALALQAVQSSVSAEFGSLYKVVRKSRSGGLSTYEFCKPDDEDTPSDFMQSGDILSAVCDECPAGSFIIPALDVFVVKRPIVGGEDFSTAASRDDYANDIWTEYATQESITTSTSTTSTTTAAGTFNADATFIGQDGSLALVKLKFPQGTELDPPIGADIIEFSHTEAAVCVFDNPVPIAWESCGTGLRAQRTLRIKNLNRPDCNADGNRIADLQSVLAGVIGIDVNSVTLEAGDGCKDDYTVDQWSIDCLTEDECLTNEVTFTYDSLPAFENEQWEVVPATVQEDATRKCGIRISAGYIDPKFGNCSFLPTDYYEMMPLKMEVSLLGEDDSNCDVANWPTVSQSKIGRIGRQSGEWVVRELLMKTTAYLKHVSQFSIDSRDREAFDMNLLNSVDRNAYYKLYYVTFRASYGAFTTWRKNEQEKFTAVFAFKEGDASSVTFEDNILNVLTLKSGVNMHVNEAANGVADGIA